MPSPWAHRCEHLFLAIWVGSMLTVGYIAVPVLFHFLDDRELAGEIAGRMFFLVYLIGLVCGFNLLLLCFIRSRTQFMREWRHFAIVFMLILIVAMFILQPQMAAIKAQINWQEIDELHAHFSQLHGIASILYLITTVMGVFLIISGVRHYRNPDSE